MLGQRVITAVILVALLLAALFLLPQAGWILLVTALALVAAYEWAQLSGFNKAFMLTYLLSVLLIISFGTGWILDDMDTFFFTLGAFLLSAFFWSFVAPLWLMFGFKVHQRILMALVGWLVIIPTALAMMVLPRPFELLALMATVWVSDIAAYFAGRAFGRHKLAPSISPGKTWEGVAGALVATLIYAEGLQRMGFSLGAQGYSLKVTLLLLVIACFGILGDLFESWIKRCAGVKDSGSVLPGHGGVLDRIDALTSALPIAALVFGLMLMGILH